MKYKVTEMEHLAAIHAHRKWRQYLHSGSTLILYHDHQDLQWLMEIQKPQEKLVRLMIEVQGYAFVLQYAHGKLRDVPDVLSWDADDSIQCKKYG